MSSHAYNHLPFPTVDIISFAFSRLDAIDPSVIIFADAKTPDLSVPAGEVRQMVMCLAAGLRARGMRPGDCVCIHSFNSIWYPLLWLAVIAGGGVVTGSNPAYTSIELIHHFKITDTKFLLVQADCIAAVKEAVLKCDIPSHNTFVLGNDSAISSTGDFISWKILWQHDCNEYENEAAICEENVQESTIAVYAATSGTTGLPKAAELSHKYLVAQATIIENLFSKRAGKITQLVCLPVFHAFAAQLSIILPLRLGITTYFMPRFHLAEYLSYVPQFQITDVAVVPPIITTLTNFASSELDSLRYVLCAGAPITATVQSKLYSKLNPAATISQCWGATELGWLTVFDQTERDCTGSVGRLMHNTKLKIVDENNNQVMGSDIPGEALIKSSSMFKRYRQNPEISAKSFDHEGYYRTGDQVYLRDGKVFIQSRIKDIMKVNGWQVSPEEIEHVICKLDGVTDCAVVGHLVANPESGLEETKPRAFVVRRVHSDLCDCDVEQHVREHLVRYKRLTGGVIFVDSIPRSNTGKILRRKLEHICAENKSDGHASQDEARLICQPDADTAWAHYCVTISLIAFCLASGLPGMILLCFVFICILCEGEQLI